MRSLYLKIVLTSVGTLLLSFVAYLAIAVTIGRETSRENFHQFAQLELEVLVGAYNTSGKEGLRREISRLDQRFGSQHFVADANWRDVLTGEDRRALATGNDVNALGAVATVRKMVRYLRGSVGVSAHWSDDNAYALITLSTPWESLREQMPYYLALFAVLAALYSWLAVRIVSLLRETAKAAEMFGNGDWDVRVTHAHRRDELGDVAKNFNAMAGRIQGLVVSQRQLLQDVSHELRSPLARLALAAELARTAPDRDEAIDQITRQLRLLTALVDELLQLTHAEGERHSDHHEVIDPEMIVAGVIETVALQARERRCHVTLDSTASRGILGDPKLVARAIDNVLRNAIHYTPVDSTVSVRITDDDHHVNVEIRDEGPGVPESMLDRIFEPFVRIDTSRQQDTGGVGLGLSIVRRIMQVHQGTCLASNAYPGLRVLMAFPAGAVTTTATPTEARPRSAA